MDERFGSEWHGRGVEDYVAEADEGDEEKEFERVGEMVGQLRGGDVEAQEKCRGEAEDGGAAEDGVDADQQADGDAPGELARRGAHAEQREDRKGDTAVSPVVMERRGARLATGWVHVAQSHSLQDRLRNEGL